MFLHSSSPSVIPILLSQMLHRLTRDLERKEELGHQQTRKANEAQFSIAEEEELIFFFFPSSENPPPGFFSDLICLIGDFFPDRKFLESSPSIWITPSYRIFVFFTVKKHEIWITSVRCHLWYFVSSLYNPIWPIDDYQTRL